MKQAFTLIETLTVIVILSITITISVLTYNKVVESSKLKILTGSAVNLRENIVNYLIKNRSLVNDFDIPIIPLVAQYESLTVDNETPWGDNYNKVYASVIKQNSRLYINVFFDIPSKGCYVLYEGAHQVTYISRDCPGPI